jgi:hypothetical protein
MECDVSTTAGRSAHHSAFRLVCNALSFWTSQPSSPQSQLAATKQYCRSQHLFYPSYNPSYNPPFSRKRRKPFRRGLPYRGAMIPRRDPPGRSPGGLQVSSKGPPRIFPPVSPPRLGRGKRERERETSEGCFGYGRWLGDSSTGR